METKLTFCEWLNVLKTKRDYENYNKLFISKIQR